MASNTMASSSLNVRGVSSTQSKSAQKQNQQLRKELKDAQHELKQVTSSVKESAEKAVSELEEIKRSEEDRETYLARINEINSDISQSSKIIKDSTSKIKYEEESLRVISESLSYYIKNKPQEEQDEISRLRGAKARVKATIKRLKETIEKENSNISSLGEKLRYFAKHYIESSTSAEQAKIRLSELGLKHQYFSERFEKLDQLVERKQRLGLAKPCGGKGVKNHIKYECYKDNIKVGYENVFGFWKHRLDVAKAQKEFLKNLKIDDVAGVCGNKDVDFKKFKTIFCSKGKLKAKFNNSKKLAQVLEKFRKKINSTLKYRKKRFQSEFKSFSANAKWFTLNFLKNLKSEKKDAVKSCVTNNYLRVDESSECFYSSVDLVACLASVENGAVKTSRGMHLYNLGFSGETLRDEPLMACHATASSSSKVSDSDRVAQAVKGSIQEERMEKITKATKRSVSK